MSKPTVTVPLYKLGKPHEVCTMEGDLWAVTIHNHRCAFIAEVSSRTKREAKRLARVLLADIEARHERK